MGIHEQCLPILYMGIERFNSLSKEKVRLNSQYLCRIRIKIPQVFDLNKPVLVASSL